MIGPLLMMSKQLSDFEKSSIGAYNNCELSLCDIEMKLNCNHSLGDFALKTIRKTGNYKTKRPGCSHKRKPTAFDRYKNSKETLTAIIKENNHFLCVSKLLKFHQNLRQ